MSHNLASQDCQKIHGGYAKHLQLVLSFWEMAVNKLNNSTMLVNGMGALILHEKV